MILCVSLNPALDVTYGVPVLRVGDSHRAELLGQRAGGKALNACRVVHQLGADVLAAGWLGGQTGRAVLDALETAGVQSRFTTIASETRRTITIVDAAGHATVVNEPGPVVDAADWTHLVRAYREMLPAARLVVLSGSLPPGAPVDAYRELIRLAKGSDVKVLLDAAGDPLRAALPAQPDVLTPNSDELSEYLGSEPLGIDEVVAACRSLIDDGAGSVVATRGDQGLVCVTPSRAFVAKGPAIVGNPTGAGDALAAALAVRLVRGDPWQTTLAFAVAVSGAAVSVATAGETDTALADRLLSAVTVEEHSWVS